MSPARAAPAPIQGQMWPARYLPRDPARTWVRCRWCGTGHRQTEMVDLGKGFWRCGPGIASDLCQRLQAAQEK